MVNWNRWTLQNIRKPAFAAPGAGAGAGANNLSHYAGHYPQVRAKVILRFYRSFEVFVEKSKISIAVTMRITIHLINRQTGKTYVCIELSQPSTWQVQYI